MMEHTATPEERTLAMLELHRWKPGRLGQALRDYHSWSKAESGEHIWQLIDEGKIGFDWNGYLYRATDTGELVT